MRLNKMANEKVKPQVLVNVWEFPFTNNGVAVLPGKSFETTDKFLANELISSGKAVLQENYKAPAKDDKK